MSSVADFPVNCHELHQESLHCHQLEEELDDWCHCWYFQNGMGLSCRSPDSWCRRFNVDNASLLIERDPPILFVSKIFCLRHSISEILFCKIVPFETNVFISIMFEHGFTKIRISQETFVDPLITLLDASLFQIMGLMIFFLLWSFPTSVAMRSSLLNHVVWNWEKVHRKFNETSIGFCFFLQEMPACAMDDAFTPV